LARLASSCPRVESSQSIRANSTVTSKFLLITINQATPSVLLYTAALSRRLAVSTMPFSKKTHHGPYLHFLNGLINRECSILWSPDKWYSWSPVRCAPIPTRPPRTPSTRVSRLHPIMHQTSELTSSAHPVSAYHALYPYPSSNSIRFREDALERLIQCSSRYTSSKRRRNDKAVVRLWRVVDLEHVLGVAAVLAAYSPEQIM
jgi:hypothetical protein